MELGHRDAQWRLSSSDGEDESDERDEGSDFADSSTVHPGQDQGWELSEKPPLPDVGPARLKVAAVGGGEVLVGGLLTPSWLVHAARAENVVIGDHCTLETIEHHHFDRVAVSLDDVLQNPRVSRALGNLVRQGSNPALDRDKVDPDLDRRFRLALRDTLIDNGAEPEELDLPLGRRPAHVTSRSGVVQVGDGSHLKTETPVYVRELVLPGADLLVRDADLRKSFVAALRAPDVDGDETETFLRDLISAAGCADHLRLLDHAADQGYHDATVFDLFGFTQVSNAGAVLSGADNTFIRDVKVDVGRFRCEDLGRTMTTLRKRLPPPEVDLQNRVRPRRRLPRIRRTVIPIDTPQPAPPPSPVRHDQHRTWPDHQPNRPSETEGPSIDPW